MFSENEVREALEFLKVAKRDLEAAELLLTKKCYPQGLFMLQQSIEKTSKAILRALRIADIETLKKEIGHRILVEGSKQMASSLNRMFKEILNEFRELKALLLKDNMETCRDEVQDIFKRIEEMLRAIGKKMNEFNQMVKQVVEQKHTGLPYLAEEVGKAVLHKASSETLTQFNNFRNNSSTYIQNPLRMIEEVKIFEPLIVFRNSLMKLRECLLRIQKETGDRERQIRLMQRIREGIDRIVRFVYLSITLMYLMLYHAMFEVNVSKLRYPDKEWSPLSISDDAPIVSKAREFIGYAKELKLLETVEEFIGGAIGDEKSKEVYASLASHIERALGLRLLEADSTI